MANGTHFEIGQLTAKNHELKENAWKGLDGQVLDIADKNDPLFQEYARQSTNAKEQLKRAKMLKEMPVNNGGADTAFNQILKIYEQVNGAYDRCVHIRAELYEKHLKKNAVMDSGKTLREYFDKDVMTSDVAKTEIGTDALTEIEKMIGGLETSIADVQDGNKKATDLSFFTRGPGGLIGVDYGKTGAAKKMLERVKNANRNMDRSENFSGLSTLIGKIEKQIDFIEQTDPAGPARRELHEWKRQYIDGMKGPFDWRPLRLAGIVTTGLVATLGLGISFTRTAFKKEPFMVDFATVGWGTGLLALAFPGFFENKTSSALKVVEKTNTNSFQNLRSAEKIGVGEEAYKVYEELQGLASNKDFKHLLTLNEVSKEQLGAVTKDPTVLKKLGKNFSDKERLQALSVLGTKVSGAEKDVMSKIIRTGKIELDTDLKKDSKDPRAPG